MSIDVMSVADSALQRIDPRVRLAAAATFATVVAVSYDPAALIAALAVSVLLAAFARLPAKVVAARLLVVNGLVVLLWVVLPFTFPGESLLRVGPLSASREGVLLAAQITLKSNAIVLAFMSLVATLAPATIGHALHRMRVPDKIVHLLLMTYRYIFVLEEEYQRLARAARIRGFRAGTDLHTYRTYAYLVGMLFVRAADRAERVRNAMLCRGFRRRFHSLQEFRTTGRDIVFAAAMAAVVVVMAGLELGGR
ncbi:MAG TPA: cobalt ECF transporter T component CbiQ [Desulfobacterales bacterium]|nr:cobalt ECF transporter T component CbiQ [Desulfobacterales bacterium]